jgi:hypothetical protein
MKDMTDATMEPTTQAGRAAYGGRERAAMRAAQRAVKADMKALRAIVTQATKREAKQTERADRLERAIKEHYRQVHASNWGADDDLWAEVGLVADAGRIG